MPKMTFQMPDGVARTVDAPDGLSVMEIALKNDIAGIEGVCGGVMACATCHVYVPPEWWTQCGGERSADEEDMLDLTFDVRKNSRLSCQIRMTEALDGLTVALPGAKG